MPSDTNTKDLIKAARNRAWHGWPYNRSDHKEERCYACALHTLADRLEEIEGEPEIDTLHCPCGRKHILGSSTPDSDVEGLVGALRGLAWRLRGTHAQFTMQDSDACLAAAARLDGTEDFMPNREPGATKIEGWLVGLPDPERSPKRPPEQLHFNPGPVPKRYGYPATLYITSRQKGVDPSGKTG